MRSLVRLVICGRVTPTITSSSVLRPTISRIALSLTSLNVVSGSRSLNKAL